MILPDGNGCKADAKSVSQLLSGAVRSCLRKAPFLIPCKRNRPSEFDKHHFMEYITSGHGDISRHETMAEAGKIAQNS